MKQICIDFSKKLQDWDGFGVNYVEACQTRDYKKNPQDYGGFSLLSKEKREEILDMIFGVNGLKPGIVKMFLDPFHQVSPESEYDHTTTTKWMRYFVKEGLSRTKAWGGDLKIITTLYGPPGWMTKQKFVRGRDLDPKHKYDCARYIISWVKYLKKIEKFPVKYISLHNEGEDWQRWPLDGSTAGEERHDYNMYWPPEQVVDFLRFMREMLDKENMQDVALTPGETTNWYRFSEWGYAHLIADDSEAIKNIGLITSHGFYNPNIGPFFGDWRSVGIDIIRAKRQDLHAWVTSMSWSGMDVYFINDIRNHIYSAKVNGIIPWAVVQMPSRWVGGDPNPGTAFHIDEKGDFYVKRGYYFYKQVCCAGQPGMAVVRVMSNDSEVALIGFGNNNTDNPDAFVVLNLSTAKKDLNIEVSGSNSRLFNAYRSSDTERYILVGNFTVQKGIISYTAPPKSVTTFYAS